MDKESGYETINYLQNTRQNRYYLEGDLEFDNVKEIYEAISASNLNPETDTANHDEHFLTEDEREEYSELANLPLTNTKVQTRVSAAINDIYMDEVRLVTGSVKVD